MILQTKAEESHFVQLNYGMEDIPLRQLELSFIEKFDSFMRIEQGFTAHKVSSYTIILRKIVRRAISQGTLLKNPFAAYIPEQPPRKHRHMTREELDKFMNVSIPYKRGMPYTGYVSFCKFYKFVVHGYV